MIVEILFILIVICDIFTLLDIRSRNIDGSQKILWSIVVLVIPILGISIYYYMKR